MPRLAASLTQIGIVGLEQRDHRAGSLVHDLGDHVERVLPAHAQADEGQIRMLTLGRRSDLRDLELA